MPYGVNPVTGRSGPAPKPPRNGDKVQARQKVNLEVKTGRKPHPNTLPCYDCGHTWHSGNKKHSYDHHLGYDAEHHYHVQAVCSLCHSKRDNPKAIQEACKLGHPFTFENIIISSKGTRKCRKCRQAYDLKRRDAAWWREYRKKRKRG